MNHGTGDHLQTGNCGSLYVSTYSSAHYRHFNSGTPTKRPMLMDDTERADDLSMTKCMKIFLLAVGKRQEVKKNGDMTALSFSTTGRKGKQKESSIFLPVS